jgi:subtilisin family serine protease
MSISCFGQETDIVQEIVKIDDVLYEVSHGERFVIDTKHVFVRVKSSVKKLPDNMKQVSETKSGIIEVEVPEGKDVVEYVNELRDDDSFENVEYKSNCNVYFSPNDMYLQLQYDYLDAIRAFDAWNFTTGSPSVKVAIIDTGIKREHPDLGYGTGNNNYSNVSYSLGYDYIEHTSYHTPDGSHGTGVAGVVGAKTNNDYRGVAGISGGNCCQGVTMISYRLVDDSGAGASGYYGDAIRQAVDDGAKVINLSIGHSETSDINNALYYAETHGVTVVCAAGLETDSCVSYPASNPYTIAVGAIDVNTSLSHYLGLGLDLVAPGSAFTTSNGTNYNTFIGTSMAAPQVTGTIALMLSINPYLTPANIRSILKNTATKVSGYNYDSNGWNGSVGYGMLNTLAAVINAMNLKIEGPQLINTYGQYHIDNFPSGVTVSWSLSDNYYNTHNCLMSNYPSIGHCLITRDNTHDMMDATLTAKIKYNGVTVRTLTKAGICAYAGFKGGYTSGNLSGNINSSGTFNIKTNTVTTVTSPNFYGATVSYSSSGATPSSWGFNSSSGILNFNTLNTTVPVIINVHDGCGNNYTLYAFPSGSYSINVSNGDGDITVTLVEDGDASKDFTLDEPWIMEITSATTGKVMATRSLTCRSETISTVGWPKGIYIVKVTIGKEELTEKVLVN